MSDKELTIHLVSELKNSPVFDYFTDEDFDPSNKVEDAEWEYVNK